jgi:anti-sigma-K factor RskA
MMAYSEDHIALAAEYALGTLDAGERAQVEAMMAADKDYAAVVEAWDRRLGSLNQMVGSVEPRQEVWERIKIAIGLSGPQMQLVLPETLPLEPAEVEPAAATATSNVIAFSQARRWRGIASAVSAIAAVLLALVVVQLANPDLLPAGLRPKAPPQQVVEVKVPTPQASAQFVALLQKDGNSPAFILTVDAASKNFTVRKVGAAAEPGKSYELWLISDKLRQPRSLGVIGGNDFTTRPVLSAYDTETVNQATYAVTLEPEGGSPSGAPTGSVVFSGKLIETVQPSASPPQQPAK